MTADTTLDELERLRAAATPGPWRWAGYVDGSIELRGEPHGQRVITSMRSKPCVFEDAAGDLHLSATACRSCRHEWDKPHDGFVDRDAPCEHPENLDTIWLTRPGEGFVAPANTWAVREVPYRGDVARVDHPDAAYIVALVHAAPALLSRLRRLEEALERLHDAAVAVTGMAGHDEACAADDCYARAALEGSEVRLEAETATCWFCKGTFVIDALIAGYDTFDEQRLACLACNERMQGNWRPAAAENQP